MVREEYLLHPIGVVESPLAELDEAPKQGDEGAPDAWLDLHADLDEALADVQVGSEVLVLTWLDQASRDVLTVHPRGDVERERQGVFSTRSPHRPNPIGLHRVRVVDAEGCRLRVQNLEAVDGTPVLDIKPVLEDPGER